MKSKITLVLALICATIFVQAQDLMYLRNKKVLEVKVIELGLEVIKYQHYPAEAGDLIVSIEKDKVSKLELANGTIYEFSSTEFGDSDMLELQHKNAIKFNFFTPLNDMLVFGYERSIKPGQSFEVELGAIGIGKDVAEMNASGVMVRGGYKFMRTPDFYVRGLKYAHILKGAYVKPELIFNAYSQDVDVYDFSGPTGYTTKREQTQSVGFLINFGKQVVFSDIFLIDYYIGIGYGFSNAQSSRFGFVGGNEDVPIAVTGGLKLGILL